MQREDRWLPDAGFLHSRRSLVGRELVEKRPAGELAEQLAHLVDCTSKHRLLRQQLASHRPPLLAHARADEDRLRHSGDAAAGAVDALFAPEERGELLGQFRLVVRDQSKSIIMM